MKIITHLDDLPVWHECNEFPSSDGDICVDWLDHGIVKIDLAEVEYDADGNEVDFDNIDLSVLRANYVALKDRWRDFVIGAITEIEDLITEYGREDFDFDPDEACFTVRLPVDPIGDDVEWSFDLQEDRAWVLDYRGWKVVDRAAVF
jgi:hypothetical protein|tara:strand:+ start:155 stop:595 length:441 start_codon:yes stop_codon:yes gene_type:complete